MKGYVLDYINENEFKKLERALKKYNMFCIFCGCALEENTVNSSCEKNINIDKEELMKISSTTKNNKSFEAILGSKFHYFVSSKENN